MTTEITAGPAADALVAVAAFGWHRSPDNLVWLDAECADTGWSCCGLESLRDNRLHPPFLPTSGDGMLEMLEWMVAKGWFVNLNYWPDGATVRLYVAGTNTLLCDRTSEATAPMAVATALLAACEATT